MCPDEMNAHELLQQGLEKLAAVPSSLISQLSPPVPPQPPSRFPADGSVGKKITLMEKFLDELEMWNRRVRLVSGDRRDIVVRHLLDSLAVYPVINEVIRDLAEETSGSRSIVRPTDPVRPTGSVGTVGPATPGEDVGSAGPVSSGEAPGEAVEIADIGSGNGFPAIPLALLDGSLRFQLVERSGKKAAFLRNAVGVLGLGGRVEILDRDVREVDRQFLFVLSRAFMPVSTAVPLMRATVGREAVLLFYAGRRSTVDEELHKLEEHSGETVEAKVLPVEVPFLSEERHVCLVYPGRRSG